MGASHGDQLRDFTISPWSGQKKDSRLGVFLSLAPCAGHAIKKEPSVRDECASWGARPVGRRSGSRNVRRLVDGGLAGVGADVLGQRAEVGVANQVQDVLTLQAQA